MKSMPKTIAVAVIVICLFMTLGFTRGPSPLRSAQSSSTIYLPIVISQPASSGVVEILPNISTLDLGDGFLHIYGEVNNGTSDNLTTITIPVDLLDSSGQTILTVDAFPVLFSLPAGDHTCFKVSFEIPAGLASYRFEAPTYQTNGYARPALTLINPQGSIDPGFGYNITGQVRNDTGRLVNYVNPVGTLYNAAGQVIDCDYTFVDTVNLNPGETSSFTLPFTERNDYTGVANYRVQVDGEIQ